jgi:5-methylcytosine-specific restriction protein A
MEAISEDLLSLLIPTEKKRIIDLVESAGINISDWANYKGNEPSTNPKYCYEWSFVSEASKTMVCCLWHDMLIDENGKVSATFNVLKTAEGQKAQQRKRAHKLHNDLHRAKDNNWAIRAVIVSEKSAHNGTSKVDKRLLDDTPWFVENYDPYSNEWKLARGLGEHQAQFVDQFSSQMPVPRNEVTSSVFTRNAKEREKVLLRAQGHCEFCGAKGFQMPSGARYLETHHIIPLAEEGPDNSGNMIALCPNDHREVHYGVKAQSLRKLMLNLLVSK